MGLVLPQMISDRTHQPASHRAMARRFGSMHRSLALMPPPMVDIGLSLKDRSSLPAAFVSAAERPLGVVA